MVISSSTAQLVRRTLVSLGVATALSVCMAAGAMAQEQTPTPHSDSVGAAVSDTAITAKVKSSFVGDERLKGSHIKVVTTNGVVTLTGTAPTSDSKSAAEELAQGVKGVRSVDDQVGTPASGGTVHKAVASTERVGSDSWITTKVKSEIMADSVTKGFDVHVKTLHGVVMLRGTLPNKDAIDHVKDIAQKIDHVKSVDTTELRTAT
ncbi:MAG TPA: BON domain-containing protein [Steroidobacteraceae bacterium]|jgi:hyperosmotically inducible protein|nr:BON domain-containing protein [Steroidobacteraceae bacterium]